MAIRYGSDPLKTYLPESDIDITVLRREFVTSGTNIQGDTSNS